MRTESCYHKRVYPDFEYSEMKIRIHDTKKIM